MTSQVISAANGEKSLLEGRKTALLAYLRRMTLKRYLFFLTIISFVACKKDVEIPVTPQPTNASFMLVSSGGNCSVTSIQGNFSAGSPVGSTHIVTLQVNVLATGSYSVYTTNVDGISFSGSGNFTTTGIQTITLRGSGTPSLGGNISFPVIAGSSTCNFIISVAGNSVPGLADNHHMLFGNPSNAAPLVDSINNYLLWKTYYALSYSRDRGIPNWASWHLYSEDLGTTSRQDDFRPDNTLPAGWYQVEQNSYSGSGFDRGHNVPSADRTSTVEANSSTFFMTNIIPQAPLQNQLTWARLEDSLRRLVTAGFELYIVMGSYGSGGTGNNGFAATINDGKVTVPSSIWKIALVIPNGNNDSSRVNEATRVIAVNIPNSNSVLTNWKSYRVSVDAIETATGYNLLSRLPVALQSTLEARVDNL